MSEEINLETLIEKTLMPVLKSLSLEFTPPVTEDDCDDSEDLEDFVDECRSCIEEHFIKLLNAVVDTWIENMRIKQVEGYSCEMDIHTVESGMGWQRDRYDICAAILHDNVHIHILFDCFDAGKETYYVTDFYTYKKN